MAAGILYPAFGIQLSPIIAAVAMSLSSVSVISSALRLKLFKKRHFALRLFLQFKWKSIRLKRKIVQASCIGQGNNRNILDK